MWVALEGPDGAGKTTLAQKLAKRIEVESGCQAEVNHVGPPASFETVVDENLERRLSYVPGKQQVVFVRLHWGCPVYGPIYRPELNIDGYGDLGPNRWKYIELSLAAIGAVTVLVTGDPDVLVARINERGDDYVDTKDIRQICETYERLRHDSVTVAGMVLDPVIMGDSLIDVYLDDLMFLAKSRESFAAEADIYDCYVGSQEPETLFIIPVASREKSYKIIGQSGNDWKKIGIVTEHKANRDIENLRHKTVISNY